MLDRANDRVLRIDATTGAASTLSPRSGTNLLDAPLGIATRPDGEVLVLNGAEPRIVSIDPVTGAQTDVGNGAALDLGTGPAAIDVTQRDPAPDTFATAYVAADGELVEVTRDADSATGAPFSAFPAGITESPVALAIRTPSTGPIDLFVATATELLRYDGDAEMTTLFWPSPAGVITGVDIAGSLFIARRAAECPSQENGVYLYFSTETDFQAYAVGDDLSCPGAIAVNPPSSGIGSPTLYAIQDAESDAVVEVTIEASPQVAVLATPTGANPPELVDLAVYLPEPASAATGLGALAALAGVARAKRRAQSAA
ncbi:MAG: hypothetical protein DCC71_02380 [Proteobacteria bacterium]|nr:MAG: hypothetical protein DCC71_02380 [Pseudomonadota bacterium]